MNYRNYLLIVLLMVMTFSGADGPALGLVFQDIKRDLNITDMQLSILTGAFSVSYAVLTIPIGRWVDRGDRVTIITLTNALWSAALLLCGVVTNFIQLLAVRIGVALGQSGCQSPAHSLVPDYFDRAERARAVAFYMLGGSLGYVLGYFVAGLINELYGWRVMFVVLGLPGLAIAILARLTLREPRRGEPALSSPLHERPCSARQAPPVALPSHSLREAWSTLWGLRTFRHLLLYFAAFACFNTGISMWEPAYFVRSFGMRTGELGGWLALIYGAGGIVGTYLGGAWASRYAINNERLQFRVGAAVYVSLMFCSAGIYLSENSYQALGLLAINTVVGATVAGPLFATLQTLVPERMRATARGFMSLCSMLFGGLGPLLVGALSDALRPWASDQSLRYASLILCPGYFWAALHLWQASGSVTRDLAATRERHEDGDNGARAVQAWRADERLTS